MQPHHRPPPPGSDAELAAFASLQSRVTTLYRTLARNPRLPQTVVIVPSLSMDPRELEKITGFYHYEERMLVNLMLLRQPRTKIVYVTSHRLDPAVVDYYLSLLPGIPNLHATRRLVMLDCNDRSIMSLSQKILARPRLIERIRSEVLSFDHAHMVCFNSTPWERSLSVALGLPLNSVDPKLADLGTKSGCREVFRQAGVRMPFGFERLTSPQQMGEALAEIKRRHPEARKAVVKLNEGFSGEGNAIFRFQPEDTGLGLAELARRLQDRLPTLEFAAPMERWETFAEKFADMQGVVEAWVEGDIKMSPSAQCRVSAIGEPQVISTHDQVLGGPSGQVFEGCTFPAADAYRLDVQESGARIASELASRGVIGRFGIDFVSVKTPQGEWEHYAIEVNLRKGGTTHPFLTLKFLTNGSYSLEDGLFYAPSGKPKYYFATDTLQDDRYVGLRPTDLIDIAVLHDMHFHGPSERGVVFHLIGALSEFGKVGIVSIGDNLQQAKFLYKQALEVLDEETGKRPNAR